MRYDIRILWLEDTPVWQNGQQENLEMLIEDMGLSVDFDWIQDAHGIVDRINTESEGFRLIDIFLVDYTLSKQVLGNNVIEALRGKQINADILFYSSEHENEIREMISKNINGFEGVYVSNRNNFGDQCIKLIEKNSRSLMSLLNIRGTLMDYTAENDFVMNSYLLQEYNELLPDQKDDVRALIIKSLSEQKQKVEKKFKSSVQYIESKNCDISMKKILNFATYEFSLENRYLLLDLILTIKGETIFKDHSILQYLEQVIKLRNTLAHKKLDVCRQQQYIKYADNIQQYDSRACGEDCMEHNEENKISAKRWQELRKEVVYYAKLYDSVLTKMTSEKEATI